MRAQEVTKTENSKNQLDFHKNSAKHKNKRDGRVARGAGFERRVEPTDHHSCH